MFLLKSRSSFSGHTVKGKKEVESSFMREIKSQIVGYVLKYVNYAYILRYLLSYKTYNNLKYVTVG